MIHTDPAFLEGEETTCETCSGRRFEPEVMVYTLDGLTFADVDDLTVDEALERIPTAGVAKVLTAICEVGLGHLRLGQPLTTLSGGEGQRLEVARELRSAEQRTVYVLDEPTTGLHLSDIDTLLAVLDQLVDAGHTVVVIEHNLDVIRHAEWAIDLGSDPASTAAGCCTRASCRA